MEVGVQKHLKLYKDTSLLSLKNSLYFVAVSIDSLWVLNLLRFLISFTFLTLLYTCVEYEHSVQR
jgi:hypothetical protein